MVTSLDIGPVSAWWNDHPGFQDYSPVSQSATLQGTKFFMCQYMSGWKLPVTAESCGGMCSTQSKYQVERHIRTLSKWWTIGRTRGSVSSFLYHDCFFYKFSLMFWDTRSMRGARRVMKWTISSAEDCWKRSLPQRSRFRHFRLSQQVKLKLSGLLGLSILRSKAVDRYWARIKNVPLSPRHLSLHTLTIIEKSKICKSPSCACIRCDENIARCHCCYALDVIRANTNLRESVSYILLQTACQRIQKPFFIFIKVKPTPLL
jgi:hypothetical protein